MSTSYAHCLDAPELLLDRELCLSEVSKDLEGEVRLLESEREECVQPKCKTLKTLHLLELAVRSHRPCDSRAGRVLDGVFTVRDLAHAFARGDGNRRGIHAGRFRWRGRSLLVTGTLSGVTTRGRTGSRPSTTASPATPTATWRGSSAERS